MKLQPRHGYLAAGLISGLTLGVGGTLAFSASAAPGGDEYGKLNVFSSAYAMILSRYVHEIPAEKLIGAAVRAGYFDKATSCSPRSGWRRRSRANAAWPSGWPVARPSSSTTAFPSTSTTTRSASAAR
jgi:hypothetical protein